MNINEFVAQELSKGKDIDGVRRTLLSVGWKEDEVQEAVAKALLAQGVPAPEEMGVRASEKRMATVEVVVNFFSFVLLGAIATALGVLYFGIIDRYFPDPLRSMYSSYDSSSASIHYAIAALLVSFPLYVFAVRLWFRRFREDAQKEESKLSRWLTYIVLLVAALTIVGDLISVVFNFLQGEISARFYLKALTILTIAVTVFGFYFLERKKIQYKKAIPRSTFLRFGYGIGGVVLFGIVMGFFAAGTPALERERQLDLLRAEALRSLAGCIGQYAQEKGRLPEVLSDLDQSSMYSPCAYNRYDPISRAEYEYQIIEQPKSLPTLKDAKEAKFELCATFSQESVRATQNDPRLSYPYSPEDKWMYHGVGRSCDTETITIRDLTGMMAKPVAN